MKTVSVIVPLYNEPEDRFGPTIDSAIYAGAAEVVVVDDGSASPPEVRASPFVKLYRLPENRGIAAALNTAIRESSGDYISWLSCGDTMDITKLKYQQEFMESKRCLASYHDYRTNGKTALSGDLYRLESDNQFCAGTTMVDRGLFFDHGLWFDESFRWCVDWEWACRVHYRGPGWSYLSAVLADCSEHEDGHTRTAQRDEGLNRARHADRRRVLKRWGKNGTARRAYSIR